MEKENNDKVKVEEKDNKKEGLEEKFKNKPIPPEVQEVADYEYREESKAKMVKAGLYLPSRPSVPEDILDSHGNVALPSDITNIDDEDLGRYLSIFTALSAYAEGIVAVTDIDSTTSDRVATFAERIEILKLPKDKQKNDDLRYGAVHNIDYVREYRKKAMQDEATFKISSGLLRAYEKAIMSLSREITRRANTYNYGKYEDNLDKRGKR